MDEYNVSFYKWLCDHLELPENIMNMGLSIRFSTGQLRRGSIGALTNWTEQGMSSFRRPSVWVGTSILIISGII